MFRKFLVLLTCVIVVSLVMLFVFLFAQATAKQQVVMPNVAASPAPTLTSTPDYPVFAATMHVMGEAGKTPLL